jgi:hypothetical protein
MMCSDLTLGDKYDPGAKLTSRRRDNGKKFLPRKH